MRTGWQSPRDADVGCVALTSLLDPRGSVRSAGLHWPSFGLTPLRPLAEENAVRTFRARVHRRLKVALNKGSARCFYTCKDA
jgi:hypothetical protein